VLFRSLDGTRPPQDILRQMVDRLQIRKFEVKQPSLNAIFLEAVGHSPSEEKGGVHL
jgi:ABC-type uncharacterized transport system ATPase subunit